jgi:hypothetical protein
VEVPPRTKTIAATKKAMVTIFLTGTKLMVLDILRRKQKFNQDHFLAVIAPEISNENTSAKGRVHTNQLVVHTDKSICCHERKIREHFARKTTMRVSHSFYSLDFSPFSIWFFGHAKERMKDQIVTSENNLEDKLTKARGLLVETSLNHCSTSGYQDWNA